MPSTVRSGNLSVLKKRWEQQQQEPSSHRAQPQTTSCNLAEPQTHISQSTGPKPAPSPYIENHSGTLNTTTLSQDQDTEPETQVHTETTSNQLQSAQPEDLANMEAKPSGGSEGLEGAAGVSDPEKPTVPLTSLKMMFEKGENPTNKASLVTSYLTIMSKHAS